MGISTHPLHVWIYTLHCDVMISAHVNEVSVMWSKPFSPADVGLFIARVRRERGLTQAQVADAIGVDRRYVHEIETGKDNLYARRLFELFTLLAIDVSLDARDET